MTCTNHKDYSRVLFRKSNLNKELCGKPGKNRARTMFRKLFDRLPSSFCRRMLRVCESLTPNFIDQSFSSIDKDGHSRSLVNFQLIYHHRVRRPLNLCIFIWHKPGIGVEDLTFLGGHIRSHEGGEGMYDSLLQDDCSL